MPLWQLPLHRGFGRRGEGWGDGQYVDSGDEVHKGYLQWIIHLLGHDHCEWSNRTNNSTLGTRQVQKVHSDQIEEWVSNAAEVKAFFGHKYAPNGTGSFMRLAHEKRVPASLTPR